MENLPLDLSLDKHTSSSNDTPLDLTQSSSDHGLNLNLLPQPPCTSTHIPSEGVIFSNTLSAYSQPQTSTIDKSSVGREGTQRSRCFYAGKSWTDLQPHLKAVHQPNDGDQQSAKFPVDDAVKMLSPLLPKESHISKPTSSNNYSRHHCTYCGWQCDLDLASYFSKHMEQHTYQTGSVYKCTYCNQEFHDANGLKAHLFSHNDVYNYICSFCTKAFPTDLVLTEHMEQHIGQNKPGDLTQKPLTNSTLPNSSSQDFDCTTSEIASTKITPNAETNKGKVGSPNVSTISDFSSSLAKHIEKAITKEYTDGSMPRPTSIGDLMFMVSKPAAASSEAIGSSSRRQPLKVESDGLSLLGLLGRVVKNSLEKSGESTSSRDRKQDFNFVVTFSEDEDEDEGFSSISSGDDPKEAAVGENKKSRKRKQSFDVGDETPTSSGTEMTVSSTSDKSEESMTKQFCHSGITVRREEAGPNPVLSEFNQDAYTGATDIVQAGVDKRP